MTDTQTQPGDTQPEASDKLDKGVLMVTVPKAEESKPRKITIL